MIKPAPIKCLFRVLAGLAPIFFAGNVMADWALNLRTPASSTAQEILTLHNLIMLICFIIAIIVFGIMFYSMFAHRKSRGAKAATFHHSTILEIFWTIIPALILFAMAIPSTATLVRMEDTTEADMTLKVTGYQWFWGYEYLDDGVSFYSKLATPRAQIENKEEKSDDYLLAVDNEVVLPVGKKIRFLFSAVDVIHAWWVPEIGVKKDAIPGYVTEYWVRIDEPGVYRGQCAELCGKDHGFMPIVVRAVTEAEFGQWVAENATPVEEEQAEPEQPAEGESTTSADQSSQADAGHSIASN